MQGEIAINLGVDFGTRFTKICVRSDEIGTAVVDFGGGGLVQALIPSVVTLDGRGLLSVPAPGAQPSQLRSISYLKMALADRGELGVGSDIAAVDRTEDGAKALSAFFLSNAIAVAKRWVADRWKDHIGDRHVQWSANVGLPVEYVDSDVRLRFQEAIAVAWDWAEREIPSGTIKELVRAYRLSDARNNPDMSFCQTCPEIAAAVSSFATSRSAAPGIYVYFDIGGGTVDGVIFNLVRRSGEVRINFYSGHVESLGVDWIADDVCRRLDGAGSAQHNMQLIKTLLLTQDSEKVDAAFARYAKDIGKMTGRVIYEGKLKDGRNWRQERIQGSAPHRTLRHHRGDATVNPLNVFLGGGGNGAPFFQKSIANGYLQNTLNSYGVPPLELIEVPAPADLGLGSVAQSDYHRFLVAYGLSIPFGEGPEIGLPSQFERHVPPPPQISDYGMPDYGDHKDIFD